MNAKQDLPEEKPAMTLQEAAKAHKEHQDAIAAERLREQFPPSAAKLVSLFNRAFANEATGIKGIKQKDVTMGEHGTPAVTRDGILFTYNSFDNCLAIKGNCQKCDNPTHVNVYGIHDLYGAIKESQWCMYVGKCGREAIEEHRATFKPTQAERDLILALRAYIPWPEA